MSLSTSAVFPSAPCRLCGQPDRLILGHVMPQFVYRACGEARTPGTSRRTHDGPTSPMLCRKCEQEFSRHESEFARRLFHPLRKSPAVRVNYRAWLLKFAVSVCWRVLEHAVVQSERPVASPRFRAEIALAHATWRDYLAGRRSDVGSHHVHLLMRSPQIDFGPSAAIAMEVVESASGAYVVARLGPCILVGVVSENDPAAWCGTRLHAEGRVKPREVAIPQDLRTHFAATGLPPGA